MSNQLTLAQVALLSLYAVAMSAGQVLFKLAASKMPGAGPLAERITGLLQNGMFGAALFFYGALAIVWVWILSFTPLSRAYAFVALAFAITPMASAVLFAEPISLRLVIGIVLIGGGLICVGG
jgi:drug/metabolite transporter (DMT)-like permease